MKDHILRSTGLVGMVLIRHLTFNSPSQLASKLLKMFPSHLYVCKGHRYGSDTQDYLWLFFLFSKLTLSCVVCFMILFFKKKLFSESTQRGETDEEVPEAWQSQSAARQKECGCPSRKKRQSRAKWKGNFFPQPCFSSWVSIFGADNDCRILFQGNDVCMSLQYV